MSQYVFFLYFSWYQHIINLPVLCQYLLSHQFCCSPFSTRIYFCSYPFFSGNYLAAASSVDSLSIFSLSSENSLKHLSTIKTPSPVHCIAWSSDESLLFLSSMTNVYVYRFRNNWATLLTTISVGARPVVLSYHTPSCSLLLGTESIKRMSKYVIL
ncbi:hypothetical protein GEMRC1_004768 [Eukaryota sp. GEM-RC1]